MCLFLGLIQLVDDVQKGLEEAKKIVDATEMTDPVKVTYAVKQLAREGAVGESHDLGCRSHDLFIHIIVR